MLKMRKAFENIHDQDLARGSSTRRNTCCAYHNKCIWLACGLGLPPSQIITLPQYQTA